MHIREGARLLPQRKGHFWTTESKLAYLFLLPATVYLIAFMIYPILNVIYLSLYKTNRMAKLTGFAGFSNYRDLFVQREFWEIMLRSIYWTALAVAVKTGFGMIIALLLNVEYRGRKIARTLIIIPWASSVPISALLWTWVYHPEFGLLNYTLKATGIVKRPPVWLGMPKSAFFSVIWVDIWIGIPFMTLVFLAGMQAISRDLYEAAEVDGANTFQRFTHITIPGLRNVLLIATLLSILWTFNDFNTIYIMTQGGPANSTHILITYIYEHTFHWLKWHYGAVMAVITFIILSAIAWVYARFYFKKGIE
jgi:multiple sugar transport system permease protein